MSNIEVIQLIQELKRSEIEELLQLRVSEHNKGGEKYKIAKPTRGFMSNMAYPQYKNNYSDRDIISVRTWVELQCYVQKKMNDKTFGPNAEVRKHMISILSGIVPFEMRIVANAEVHKQL